MTAPSLRYLSLGAGVQSTTLALLIEHGEVPAVDCAIFADTQWEPRAVYEHLDWLEKQLSFPVHRVTAGSLRAHVLAGVRQTDKRTGAPDVYRGIPAYTRNHDGSLGMLRRQCTREYKIAPIVAKVRQLLGLTKGQRVPRGVRVEQLTGISLDESDRAKPAQESWLTRLYPLLDLRMRRGDCLAWMARHGYPQPPRSACIGCPLHTLGEWQRIRGDETAWADAVEVDEALRAGLGGGIKATDVFLHARGKPLVDAVADPREQHALDLDDRGGWPNECEGLCGV